MSSTNKTPNYNLSQFIDSDKPSWRGDYNADMSKIDTGIKGACTQAQAAATLATEAKTSMQAISDKVTSVETTSEDALSLARTNQTDIAANEATLEQYQATVSDQFTQRDTRLMKLSQSLQALTELVGTKLTAPPEGYQSGAHMEMHFTRATWSNTFTPNGTAIYIPFDDPYGNGVGKWAVKKNPGEVELKPGTYLFIAKTRVDNIQSGQHSFDVGFELNVGENWFTTKVLASKTYSYDLASSAPPAEALIASTFQIGQDCLVRLGVKARGTGSSFTAVIGESHVQIVRLNDGTGSAHSTALLHAIDDVTEQSDM